MPGNPKSPIRPTAAKDPDFKIQGEYVGEGSVAGDADVKVGAQVIALGNGQFTVVVTKGGLPGDGWKRGDRDSRSGRQTPTARPRSALRRRIVSGQDRRRSDDDCRQRRQDEVGIEADRAPQSDRRRQAGRGRGGPLRRHDGRTTFPGTLLPDGNLLSEETSKQGFGDYTLHVEFRLSYMPEARGQARSNSGVYLHDCYEIQVLDSFGLEGEDDECGGLYGLRQPDVNMCFPPLTWQTYDVEFTAPKYQGREEGGQRAGRRCGTTAWWFNRTFELPHATPGRQGEGPAPRPLYLQGHGNKVEYRNIWVKEKSDTQAGWTETARGPLSRPRSSGTGGDLVGDGLAFLQFVELVVDHHRVMEEDVSAGRRDEPEATVRDEFLNGTLRHRNHSSRNERYTIKSRHLAGDRLPLRFCFAFFLRVLLQPVLGVIFALERALQHDHFPLDRRLAQSVLVLFALSGLLGRRRILSSPSCLPPPWISSGSPGPTF